MAAQDNQADRNRARRRDSSLAIRPRSFMDKMSLEYLRRALAANHNAIYYRLLHTETVKSLKASSLPKLNLPNAE